MKKLISIACSLIMIMLFVVPAYAADSDETVVWQSETVFEDGIRIVEKITVNSAARGTEKDATRSSSFYYGDNLVGQIAFRATYYYDGSIVRVVSKSVTQTTTYIGWNYRQNSFTSSGGTVTLDAKLTKLLILNVSVDMSMTCDVNGNITKG